jgi:hypothetical protein
MSQKPPFLRRYSGNQMRSRLDRAPLPANIQASHEFIKHCLKNRVVTITPLSYKGMLMNSLIRSGLAGFLATVPMTLVIFGGVPLVCFGPRLRRK